MDHPDQNGVSKRVKYTDGTLGTISRITDDYVYVRWDTRKRVNRQWVVEPGEDESATTAKELEWA